MWCHSNYPRDKIGKFSYQFCSRPESNDKLGQSGPNKQWENVRKISVEFGLKTKQATIMRECTKIYNW